ncbi:hypothetical protein [Moorena sp. SIO4A5]|uniref:hypothetical protein n=1 Tax=Moorena sp. SIO4A5 TaxID=2607838 RepID=UPI0013C6E0C8|nr:hypothetical protein [Moorena sp. SIO4A5]NEO24182.1 hypothetical protein [Moorena sp. SIO4A5]
MVSPTRALHQDKAPLSYGNYRLWRRLAVGHAKGEREQTMSNCRGSPHSRFASRQEYNDFYDCLI